MQRSIVNKLIRGGADFLKDAVNPVELLKLRNYVGPHTLSCVYVIHSQGGGNT